MYILKRREQPIIDELVLGDGPDAEVLKIHINPTFELLKRYRQNQVTLMELSKSDLTKDENITLYGKTICETMALLLGDENAEKIIAFYENNYTEMLLEILPFLRNNLVPRMELALKSYKKKFK